MSKTPKPDVPRESRHTGADGIAVTMPAEKCPGVQRYGDLKPGVIYVLAPAEAVRLVRCKGFEYASAEDKRAGEAHEATAAQQTEKE